MVVVTNEHALLADVIFVIEGTAINGAYINDLKANYIIPTLEYFSQGNLDEVTYLNEHANCLYGIVLYFANDCLLRGSSDTIGPFTSPGKVLGSIDRLELIGGKGEYHANIAEGFATALACFEELQAKRDHSALNIQKHCILICNSPPYLMPVMESYTYAGKTAEQLAQILQEKNINLSILSPRKIPNLYKLFEKAGGDLNTSQTKNYAKDPRHLVLLKGYSLKERPISPISSTGQNQQQSSNSIMPASSLPVSVPSSVMPSIPSPISNDSPIGHQSMNPQNTTAAMLNINMMNNQVRTNMIGPGGQFNPPQANFQPGIPNARPPRWPTMMHPGQQRPPYMAQPQQQTNTTQQSALIAQLTQPSQSTGVVPNQFGQIGSNSPTQQQQQIRQLGMQQQTNIQQQGGQIQQQQQSQVQVQTTQAPQTQQQPTLMSSNRERQNIWQGLLEWVEKPKNPGDLQKVTKQVPCTVSANAKDGEPELTAEGWPQKLIMQLMPKQLIGTIGGAYLKNSKSVLFHPQNCDALESLTKVMHSGFAGCVHFTSLPNTTCDIKVLMLLYTAEKRAYLGFIPNDQVAFVDRLRKVIQQQKSTQMMRQAQGGVSLVPPPPPPQSGPVLGTGPNQLPTSSSSSQQQQNQQQQQQQMINVGAAGGNLLGPNPNVPVQNRMRMPANMQQQQQQQQQQQGNNAPSNPQTLMMNQNASVPVPVQQRAAPFENLVVERQQNLEKINQLKQTLEAAQQQEQQYKRQIEGIHNMKEALSMAQQQELQFKLMDQQRLQQQAAANQQAAAAAAAAANVQQQRMMRPGMSNNPGLRHLLQQQPPFRQQQMMGMQQQMQQQGNQVQVQQQQQRSQQQQMSQQMQNPAGANQPSVYDEVNNFNDYI